MIPQRHLGEAILFLHIVARNRKWKRLCCAATRKQRTTLTFVLTRDVEQKRDSTSVSLFGTKSRLLSAKLVEVFFSNILFFSFC